MYCLWSKTAGCPCHWIPPNVANLLFRPHACPTASPNHAFNVDMLSTVRLCEKIRGGGAAWAPLASLAPFCQENGTCPNLLQSCRFPGHKLHLHNGLMLQSQTWGGGLGKVCPVGDPVTTRCATSQWVPTQEVRLLRNPCMLSSLTKPEGCGQSKIIRKI